MLIRNPAPWIAAAALLLAGCGQSGSNGTSDAVKIPGSAVSGDGALRAGLYDIVQTGDVEIQEQRCFDDAWLKGGRFVPPGSLDRGWTVAVNRVSGGTIELSASHVSGGRMMIKGIYGSDYFSTDNLLETKVNGQSHVVRSKQQARFVSATCPAGTGGSEREDGE